MALYDAYKHLVGLPYEEGNQDCYGLFRRYYKDNYGLELENYARPGDFAHAGLDLIMDYFKDEGFKLVEASLHRLELGDAVLCRINGAPLCNHVGVYVGNQMVLHHLYASLSKDEPYTDRWKSRTLSVVRHPEVTKKNLERIEPVDFMNFVSPDVQFPEN